MRTAFSKFGVLTVIAGALAVPAMAKNTTETVHHHRGRPAKVAPADTHGGKPAVDDNNKNKGNKAPDPAGDNRGAKKGGSDDAAGHH